VIDAGLGRSITDDCALWALLLSLPERHLDAEGREASGMATTRRKTTPALAGAAQAGTTPWTGALRFDVYEENSAGSPCAR
jgi:hypothetical protein